MMRGDVCVTLCEQHTYRALGYHCKIPFFYVISSQTLQNEFSE